MSSLTAIGTPASGSSDSVSAKSAASASAAASAGSAIVTRNALVRPSSASIRARQSSTSSRGCTCPARTSAANAAGPAKASSCSAVTVTLHSISAPASARKLSAQRSAQRVHELADRRGIAIGDAAVRALEQLQRVLHPKPPELLGERLGAQIEKPLDRKSGG